MGTATLNVSEYDVIANVVQHYIDGAKSGKGDDMKPAFHEDATIFGYAGADLFAGPIQRLFDWVDENDPATGLQVRIASIDVVETVAIVRIELDDWNGSRYTDLFTLLKVDGEWKIMNKVFHLHASGGKHREQTQDATRTREQAQLAGRLGLRVNPMPGGDRELSARCRSAPEGFRCDRRAG